jgi:hypothetical protein
MQINKRISARVNQYVDLSVDFYRGGKLEDPFAIRKVEIYKGKIAACNLVATLPILPPSEDSYPYPVQKVYTPTTPGLCGTDPTASETPIVGKYKLTFLVPNYFESPDIYYDVWYYYPSDPCIGEDGTITSITACDLDDPTLEEQLLKCCHRFWLYPDDWFCDDKLQTLRFGFEPLDVRFNKPETRPLEVGIMPLPLYDYNYNLVSKMIPYIRATITIETQHHEIIVDDEECRLGIRTGSYRTNPFVLQYDLDTSRFLKGTYQYSIVIHLPDGSTRASKKYHLSVM